MRRSKIIDMEIRPLLDCYQVQGCHVTCLPSLGRARVFFPLFSLAEIRDRTQFINCATQSYFSLKFSLIFVSSFHLCLLFALSFFNDGVIYFVSEFQTQTTFKKDNL